VVGGEKANQNGICLNTLSEGYSWLVSWHSTTLSLPAEPHLLNYLELFLAGNQIF